MLARGLHALKSAVRRKRQAVYNGVLQRMHNVSDTYNRWNTSKQIHMQAHARTKNTPACNVTTCMLLSLHMHKNGVRSVLMYS